MSEPRPAVRLEREEDIGVITVDYPPVNALGPGVPEGITTAINQANTDPAIRAMVLMGAGRSFIAGADIRQFGKPRVSLPLGQRVYDILDASEKPVVAAIHGHALGGGFEIALACHYRIAVPTAKVGLPEVLLGILPGGGGTQRLPRVVGCKVALEMITTGRHVGAPEAARLGILDAVLPDGAELRAEAVAFARSIAERRPLPRVREWDMAVAEPELFEATRQAIARRSRNQTAPYHCIAAVEAACTLPFDEGIKRERELFNELENSAEARALRYAFFAEREVTKLPNVPDSVRPRELRSVAVIGAGTMGSGIAMAFANHGYFVRIIDATPEALARGMERVRANYAMSVRRGSLAREEAEWRLARIAPVHDYQDIAECDVAIEAVCEEVDIKRAVFRKLDAVMKKGALLLSDTSGPDIDELAAETRRPGDVAGAYFFSPANVMKLLEIVRGKASSAETLVTAMHMGRRIGKVAVLAGNADGFVANRTRRPLVTESVILLEEGCLPEQVDRVIVEFGYPMGPFAVADLAGLDIGAAVRRRRAAADPNYRALSIADRLVALGRHGQKTGAGWYRYGKGDRTPRPDPEVTRIVCDMAKEHRAFGDQEILHRLLFASVNEACRILEEGQACRASDIDVMWLHGFGFPRYRGGLMFWADGIGTPAIYQQVSAWHQQLGDRWAPSRLLRDVAERGLWLRELQGVTA